MRPQRPQRLDRPVRRHAPIAAQPHNDDGGDRIRNPQAAQLPDEAGVIAGHGIETAASIQTQRRLLAFRCATARLVHGEGGGGAGEGADGVERKR